MPFEIPKHFSAETRSTIETALEDAWQELSKGTLVEATPTKRRLVRTMVALASVGETDLNKLKWFATLLGADRYRSSRRWRDGVQLAVRLLNHMSDAIVTRQYQFACVAVFGFLFAVVLFA